MRLNQTDPLASTMRPTVMTILVRNHFISQRLGLVALLAFVLAGCGSNADFANGPDCGLPPLHFDGREYLMGKGPVDLPPQKGSQLGDGRFGSCSDPDEMTTFEPVYRFPRVPPAQAVIVLLPDSTNLVLVVSDKPESGWDPDLRAWLDKKPKRDKASDTT